MPISIAEIRRYPVKGLTAESLDGVTLARGEGLPHDRRFAIAHGSARIDADAPRWMPRDNFLMLAKNEKLAQLEAHFDPEAGTLTLSRKGKQVMAAKVTEATGKLLVGQFFISFMGPEVRGAPKLVEARDFMFTDSDAGTLSLINLASVKDLERVARKPVDPRRFRGNLYCEGLPAWREFDWIGKEIRIGATRLKVLGPIGRCAATNVNPDTAERDLNLPLALRRGFGHTDLGVFLEVAAGGAIAPGATIEAPD